MHLNPLTQAVVVGGGVADSPRTALDGNERFHEEAAGRVSWEASRWPDRLRCPRCPQAKLWPMQAPFHREAACGHDCTVTAGPPFADTPLPVRRWFQARGACRPSEERGRCVGRPARARLWQLPHGWELVAQMAAVSPGKPGVGCRHSVVRARARGWRPPGAPGQSRGRTLATVAAGHTSGRSGSSAVGRPSARVHVPVPPARLGIARAAVATAGRAGTGTRASARRGTGWRNKPQVFGRGGIKRMALIILR